VKVTDLRIYVVDASWRNWVFLKVFTDAGLTGVGEASLEGQDEAVVATLRALKTYLVGKDPRDVERHVRALVQGSFWTGPVLRSAVGGIEMALWDILGQAADLPVHRLLGGPCRDRVRCYTHVSEATSGHAVEERAAEARRAVAHGWTALKWDPFPANYLTLRPADVRLVVAQVAALREAVGEDVELLVEAHGRLDPETALEVARAIAPYRPYFLEEPVPPDSLDALAAVARQSPIPLATGERLLSTREFWPLLERRLVGTIQPDVIHVGGILELKKIAALVEARYVRVAPHNPNGPVATAATLHLVANLPNFSLQEIPADDYLWAASWRDELLLDPTLVQVKDGYLAVPTAPGLGVELDEAAIAKYPVTVRDWGVSFQAENAILD
jgi:galactonate dehydratase